MRTAVTTCCWNCNWFYEKTLRKCPSCGGHNGNYDLPAAMKEALPKRSYIAPAGKGLVEYTWHTDCAEPIVCHLECTKACKGSFEPGGGQIEPDEPARCDLVAAYVLDVDILGLLSPSQIADIEEKAQAAQESMSEPDPDRGDDPWADDEGPDTW